MYGSYFGQSSFASHALAYESNVVVVGEEIDLGVAAPLGCGVQTGAGTVLNVLAPPPEASLVVFGAGGVGLSAVMAASAVRRRHDHRRRSGRRAAGSSRRSSARARRSIPAADDVVDEIRRLTGAGATHAIDTTAKGAVINQAIEALAPLGTLALVGIRVPDFALNIQSVMSGGKTVRGVIEGDAAPHDSHPAAGRAPPPGPAPAREADPPIRLRGHRRRVRRRGERKDGQASPRIDLNSG